MAKISVAEAKGALSRAGFRGDALNIATAIAGAESGYDVSIVGGPNSNGSSDFGLMQINSIHNPTDAEKTQPDANAAKAFQIYQAAGNSFKPWSSYNSGTYKQHLATATAAAVQGSDFDPNHPWGPELKLSPPTVSNPLEAVANIGPTITRAVSGVLTVLVGAVLVILGIVIVLRQPIGNIAGKAAKVAVKAAI